MYQIGEEESTAVTELFKRGKLFRYQGPDVATECSSFEKEYSTYLEINHALMVNSGTSALIIALKILGIGPGDEVLIPCYTFAATAAAVLHSGATPVLVNIDQSLTISLTDLEKKRTPKTKAVIAVHMDGLVCDMNSLLEFTKKHQLRLIEDVAQAIGGEFAGKKLGTLGDVGCYSFNSDKIIGCGEGGALVCNDEMLYKRALLHHDVGVSHGPTFSKYLAAEDLPVGHSMRASELSAAVMRVQLKRLDGILSGLRERKQLLVQHLATKSWNFSLGHDQVGDCATTLHVNFKDPLAPAMMSRNLLGKSFKALPTISKPAQCYWHWLKMLNLKDEEMKNLLTDLMPSKMFLSCQLKILIDPFWELQRVQKIANELGDG